MAKRQASPPPTLPGFQFIRHIGSGGYADVFLYQEQNPSRQVAVKVLDRDAAGTVADYAAEANLMAKVGPHPYIVQVHQAIVAPDGRQCLVMEYYPGDNFYDRARDEQIGVAEALRVGIQLAAAVETAHRAGILHRDIKPANVLTSRFRQPGLTDFGIASVQGPGAVAAEGLSIPWSPPEAFGESTPTDARSDVYSLAATVYTLLAGRSPFEVKGGDNRQLALMSRIERDPVTPTGRGDVPEMLERVLAGAMAKHPSHRPASAAEFGRLLQGVESHLQLAVTQLQLEEDPGSVRVRRDDRDQDDDATRVKDVVEIRPQGRAAVPASPIDQTLPRGPVATAPTVTRPTYEPAQPGVYDRPERPREGLLEEPAVADTIHEAPQHPEQLAPLAPPKKVSKWWFVGGAAAAVFAAVMAVTALSGGDGGTPGEPENSAFDQGEVNDNLPSEGNQVLAVAPPPVGAIDGADNGDGSFTFTWEPPGDDYSYAVTPEGGTPEPLIDVAEYTGFTDCISVEVVASSGQVSAPTRGCVE